MQVQLLAYLRIRNVVVFLFNVALNTFYLRFYGVRHVVKIESDGKWVNPLSPLYGLFFSIQYNKVFNVHIQSKLWFRLAVSDIIYHCPIDGTVQITGFNTRVRSWCDGSSDRSFKVDPLSYFSFQQVLHYWFNKGRGMCYAVYGIMHIKVTLLLIGKELPWSSTICPTPYKICWVRR